MKDNEGLENQKLSRVLGLKDLVLLNVVSIVSLATLAQVAQLGYASISLLIICVFTFLVPSGMAVAELNFRMPQEGGFYLWTKKAFGEFHAYVAAWCYWLSNIVFLATTIVLITVPATYIMGQDYLHLSEDTGYNVSLGLLIILVVTLLNILGVKRAKWIQNIGGMLTWMSVVLLVIFAIWVGLVHGIKTEFVFGKLIPDLTNLELLPYYALIPFCFGGLELTPIMADEIVQPKKLIPKAILMASVIVALIYILGVLGLLVVLPDNEIGVMEGVVQAFAQIDQVTGIKGLGSAGAIMVSLGTLGLFGGWFLGNARIPFIIGLNNYLPQSFAKLHTKYKSPYVSILIQSAAIAILFLSSIAGSSIMEAFLILLDMSIILYFIPFLYIFASFVWHLRSRNVKKGMFKLFHKRKFTVWLFGFLGFSTTLVALILSCVPTSHVENKMLFVLKVVGGSALLIMIGLSVYLKKKISEGLT